MSAEVKEPNDRREAEEPMPDPHHERRTTDAHLHAVLDAINALGDRIATIESRVHERIDKHERDDKVAWEVLREEIKNLGEKLTDPVSGIIMPMMIDIAKLKDDLSRRDQADARREGRLNTVLGVALAAFFSGLAAVAGWVWSYVTQRG